MKATASNQQMLSVVILTHNAGLSLRASIESVREIADEIVCVDSGSNDNTVALAHDLGARVVHHAFENYGAQRNWAIDNLVLRGHWELHLDADERLEPQLAAAIRNVIGRNDPSVAGYHVARLVRFFGQPLRHGGMYPIYHMRLFRRGVGRCEDRLYDQHFYVDGDSRVLEGAMIDDIRGSFSMWWHRHRRWARLEARQQLRYRAVAGVALEEARFEGTPVAIKKRLRRQYDRAPLFLRAVGLFGYRFVLRLGFMDGPRGWLFYVFQTLFFRLLVDAHYARLRWFKGHTKRCETDVGSETPGRH